MKLVQGRESQRTLHEKKSFEIDEKSTRKSRSLNIEIENIL